MDTLAEERRIIAMSPEVSDLLKRALSLPVDERAALANTLLDSLEQMDESVQEAWDKEVARRVKDLEAGRAVTVPWEELRRKLLAMADER
jgi:putative addiction module component (TIGR02574 family)